jgi:hypothetical protein
MNNRRALTSTAVTERAGWQRSCTGTFHYFDPTHVSRRWRWRMSALSWSLCGQKGKDQRLPLVTSDAEAVGRFGRDRRCKNCLRSPQAAARRGAARALRSGADRSVDPHSAVGLAVSVRA